MTRDALCQAASKLLDERRYDELMNQCRSTQWQAGDTVNKYISDMTCMCDAGAPLTQRANHLTDDL